MLLAGLAVPHRRDTALAERHRDGHCATQAVVLRGRRSRPARALCTERIR